MIEMGIYVEYAIETKEAGGNWKFHDADGIYEKDGIFESYLGSTYPTEIKTVFPIKKESENYENFFKGLTNGTMDFLNLFPTISPEYGIVSYSMDEILDIPPEEIASIRFTEKIKYLKEIYGKYFDVRLVIKFD